MKQATCPLRFITSVRTKKHEDTSLSRKIDKQVKDVVKQVSCPLSTLVWVYAERLDKTPKRRYASQKRTQYTFAAMRRTMADEISKPGFVIGCHKSHKPTGNNLLQTFMRLAARGMGETLVSINVADSNDECSDILYRH